MIGHPVIYKHCVIIVLLTIAHFRDRLSFVSLFVIDGLLLLPVKWVQMDMHGDDIFSSVH